MATTEELLAQLENNPEMYASDESQELVIDAETRTINIPASETLFGVKGDKNIERKYFRCPRIVGDNVDLSTHLIYIAYVYTESNSGSIFPTIGIQPYHCDDVEVDGDDITFSWKLSDHVFQSAGFIAFKMYAKEKEGSPYTVFNTAPAVGTVLYTIGDGVDSVVSEYPDIINQLLAEMEKINDIATPEAMQGYVNAYLEENPVEGGMTAEQEQQLNQNTTDITDLKSAVQQPIEYEKLGFGKTCRYGTGYFTGNIADETTKVYGSFGVIIECSAGETLYCNFGLSANNINSVQILDNVPEKNYGALTGVIRTIEEQEDGAYKIPNDLTNAKAAYFPITFNAYPNLKPENYNHSVVQNVSFSDVAPYYKTDDTWQSEGFWVGSDKNKLLYASLFSSVSPMVGAKVYVSGDSITAQSASLSSTGSYLGWYDRIAVKYNQEYERHGYEGNMWYSTSALQQSAVADVKKIIDAAVEYDYIVLEWGTNDITRGNFGNVDDAASDANDCGTVAAIRWCIENLQSNFPKTRIIVIMPCMRNKNPRQEQYYDLVDPILKSYGVRRVYMAYDSGITVSMMNSDGIHFRYQDTDGTYKQNMIGIEKYSKCLEAEMLNA